MCSAVLQPARLTMKTELQCTERTTADTFTGTCNVASVNLFKESDSPFSVNHKIKACTFSQTLFG